ncbi:hypothetical protein [uncultured Sphingomonas sp.]|uniref:hypothetical protein n=1 Tax=uncultured Sphingomonas sp. TaxID=158754 RepID=UPI0025D39566|nr:hypothetical protein [uncultured Sphingomonas sp.]
MPLSLIAYCFGLLLLLVVAVIACLGGVIVTREAPHTGNVATVERTGNLMFVLGLLLFAVAVAIVVAGEPHLVAR